MASFMIYTFALLLFIAGIGALFGFSDVERSNKAAAVALLFVVVAIAMAIATPHLPI